MYLWPKECELQEAVSWLVGNQGQEPCVEPWLFFFWCHQHIHTPLFIMPLPMQIPVQCPQHLFSFLHMFCKCFHHTFDIFSKFQSVFHICTLISFSWQHFFNDNILVFCYTFRSHHSYLSFLFSCFALL